MKSSKILILVFTLTFPVILYLFLTFYGSNEFDLPIFFENENEFCNDFKALENITETLQCSENKPYSLEEILAGNINILHFPNIREDNQQLENELNRLISTFADEDNIKLHAIYNDQQTELGGYLMQSNALTNYNVSNYFYNKLTDCYMMLPSKEWEGEHPAEVVLDEHTTLLLMDQEGRIRGYYDGLETKDVDRLILEIRILMTKQNK